MDKDRTRQVGATGEIMAGSRPAGSEIAKVEHSLKSLLELARELSVSLGLHQTADLLLFNLMGQIGTGRAALWLKPEGESPPSILIRCHGFDRAAVKRAGEGWNRTLLEQFERDPVPAFLAEIESQLSPEDAARTGEVDVALFAPMLAHSQVLGWLALGPKLGGSGYDETDLQILQAALGIVGVALQNARLHGQMTDAHRQLLATNVHLQEVDGLKSEFLRNVNHELRTPLAVVMATLESVVSARAGEARIQAMLEAALDRAHHLNALLENLLTYSSAVNARLVIELTNANIAELLGSYCEQRRAGVTASLRDIAWSSEPALPEARCDRQRVVQILDQLLDNALKFTPSGSHLQLGARAMEASGQRWVCVEFADDGPGIPIERIHSIFNSFEQVDGSQTRSVGGMGMGVALAREIAERMECRLDVVSAPNHGTAFTLRIPACV